MSDRVVGIDLGTTNSLVAYMESDKPVVIPGDDGSALVPSVVAFEGDRVLIGNAARGTLVSSPANAVFSAKRLMGRGLADVRLGRNPGGYLRSRAHCDVSGPPRCSEPDP